MKYSLLALISSVIIDGAEIFAQNHEEMEENIIEFGNETYAIQIAGYTSMVQIGSEGVLITDPANSQRAGLLKSAVAKLTNLPVTYVLLSHEHYDHVGGTEVFENAKVVGHEFMNAFFDIDETGITPNKLDITFTEHLQLSPGKDQSAELYFYAPGDGVTTTIIHFPQVKVAVAADLFMTDEALFPGIATMDDVNLLGTREILNRVLNDLKPDHVLNGHTPVTNVKYLKSFSSFYNDLYDYCKEWITKTISSDGHAAIYDQTLDFAKTAKLPKYSHWKNYHALETYVRRMVMSIHHGG